MKGKAIIPLVLGLGIGIVAVKVAVDTIRKAKAANRPSATIHAVRAREDIAAQEEISLEMVELVETADSLFAPENERIETIEEVVGRVSAKAIPQQAAVLQSMLAPPGTKPGMVGRIPPGYRAVSVKIDEVTGVAYQIRPGDWVDVIVVMDIAISGRGRKETIAEVILQNVQVAAIGRATSPQPAGSAAKGRPAKSATLLVREEDVPKLHLAGTRGRITLAMRGDDDGTLTEAASATMSDIIAMMRGARNADAKSSGDSATRPRSRVQPRWTQPEPQSPHLVLVVRGTSGRGSQEIERILFEARDSPRVLAMAAGPPSATSTAMMGTRAAPSKPPSGGTLRPSNVEGQSESKDDE
jgi:Flp pilus assembly protein CpaB